MALRPTCDVYLTAVKGVKRYRVIVMIVPPEDGAIVPENEEEITKDAPWGIFSREVDLCPQAFKCLKAKIVAGTTPPVERKKKEDKPGAAALAK